MLSMPRRRQRGLSVVELMVGVTIGLFIVAAAATMASGQMASNRLLLLDAQLQQDLRAAAEIVARDIRRSGALNDPLALSTMWRPESSSAQAFNAYAQAMTPGNGTASATQYFYVRDPNRVGFGFELNNGRLRTLLDNNWQELTDATVMQVTAFNITTTRVSTVQLPCPNECAGGGNACWPTVTVRDVDIDIRARSATEPSVQRSVRTTVRLRADLIQRDPSIANGFCPA